MTVQPTDSVANELAIRLFLFGLAAMSFYEAIKLPKARAYIAWTACGLFGLSGILLTQIAGVWPLGVAWLGELVGNPVTWFVLAMTLYLTFRHLWSSVAADGTSAPPYDDADLKAHIDKLDGTVRAVINDYQRMSGLEARTDDQLDKLKLSIQVELESLRATAQVIERKADEAAALSPIVQQTHAQTNVIAREIERIENIQEDHRKRAQHSLHAIGLRETLFSLEAVIRRDASDLYDRLKAGEKYDQERWHKWENVYGHWETALNDWLSSATWYGLAVKQRTLTVDDAKYGANWSVADDQFPDAEAVRRFKKFRIIQQQWEEVVPDVKNGIEQVAFVGLTEQEVRAGRPAG